MSKKPFSFKSRLASFKHAFRGLKTLIEHEHNARIQIAIALVVIAAGVYFQVSGGQWIALIFAMGLVLMAELFNSAVEYLSDFISEEHHELIGDSKDFCAAAVLIATLMAIAVGLIIFIPYFL